MIRHAPRPGIGFFNSPRVHFMRNLLAHAGKQGRRVVSAFVATAFAQDDADSAAAQWRLVADQLKPKAPKLAALMDEAQHDVLAYMSFCMYASRNARTDLSMTGRQIAVLYPAFDAGLSARWP